MTSTTADPVLVTGAFGQAGSRCTEILLGRGRTVIAMDLRNDKTVAVAERLAAGSGPGTLVPAYVDLLDVEAVTALVAQHQPQAIIHLAAILAPTSYKNPRLARKVNVGGTQNVVSAACALASPPLFVYASSAAVYGSRNPHRHPERITADTPINPADHYGEDKVESEKIISGSGLPHALLRLAGVISPDGMAGAGPEHLVLMRALPGDNRIHTVDGRDVAMAFANAVDRREAIDGKVLLIGGDSSHERTHRELEDEMMGAVGLGRLGPTASLPGDPDDDDGWGPTGWFDTTESQALLDFQHHDWPQTVSSIADSQGMRRRVLSVVGPLVRPALRQVLKVQRRIEKRGRYADPWTLVGTKFGNDALAPTDF
jgi:nucleoside-diphosphate-sugar epimerase